MSIEAQIQSLIEALDRNTAALTGGKIAPADVTEAPAPKAAAKAAAKPAAAKPAAKAETAAPTATLDEAMDRGLKFVTEHGRDTLIGLLTEKFGKGKIRDFAEDGVTLAKIVVALDAYKAADDSI